MVNSGHNYIGDVVNEDLESLVKSGMLTATSDFSKVANADCVCICVPLRKPAAQVSTTHHNKVQVYIYQNVQMEFTILF